MPTSTSNLGGPYRGFSATQTLGNFKDGEQASTRAILRNSWNTTMISSSTYKGKARVQTPFRVTTHAGDFLGRKNYKCGGPTGMSKSSIGWAGSKIYLGSKINNCDGTGIEGASGNVKYVYDSSDYSTYKRQKAINHNYNDLKNGGDDHNASYVPLMHVRR
jgi:hypothetical protein